MGLYTLERPGRKSETRRPKGKSKISALIGPATHDAGRNAVRTKWYRRWPDANTQEASLAAAIPALNRRARDRSV
jgi:hypothetical protein